MSDTMSGININRPWNDARAAGLEVPPSEQTDQPIDFGDDLRQQCPECGGLYQKGAGMTRHRRSKHSTGADPERITCKVEGCHARLSKKNYGRHLRESHGITGGVSGKPRAAPKTRPVPQALTSEMDDLSADQIVGTVVKMLWPESMPTTQMGSVMKFYGDTEEFLRKVRNGPRS